MISYIELHDEVKSLYKRFSQDSWWGDDLDVRFFLLKKLMNIKNKYILDIGCNIGIIFNFLDKSNKLFGIDIEKNFCFKAKEINFEVNILNGSMENLPFKNETFDIITMMNVIPGYDFECKNYKRMIESVFFEIHRVLKKEGILYLTTPNGKSIYYQNRNKILIDELKKYLHMFNIKILGWNSLNFRFFYPKLFYRINLVWKFLEKNMKKDVHRAKFFYVEARKC